jgi:hypothetical protein
LETYGTVELEKRFSLSDQLLKIVAVGFLWKHYVYPVERMVLIFALYGIRGASDLRLINMT